MIPSQLVTCLLVAMTTKSDAFTLDDDRYSNNQQSEQGLEVLRDYVGQLDVRAGDAFMATARLRPEESRSDISRRDSSSQIGNLVQSDNFRRDVSSQGTNQDSRDTYSRDSSEMVSKRGERDLESYSDVSSHSKKNPYDNFSTRAPSVRSMFRDRSRIANSDRASAYDSEHRVRHRNSHHPTRVKEETPMLVHRSEFFLSSFCCGIFYVVFLFVYDASLVLHVGCIIAELKINVWASGPKIPLDRNFKKTCLIFKIFKSKNFLHPFPAAIH